MAEYKKCVKLAMGPRSVVLPFPPQDSDSLLIKFFSGASFASNDDLSSHISFIIHLADNSGCVIFRIIQVINSTVLKDQYYEVTFYAYPDTFNV